MNGGFGLGVNKLSRNSKIAIEFIRFATSPQMQKMRSMRNCGVEPTRISVLSDPEYYSYSANSNLFAATYKHITPWKKNVRDNLEITNVLHKFMTGETGIVSAVSSLRGLLTR